MLRDFSLKSFSLLLPGEKAKRLKMQKEKAAAC